MSVTVPDASFTANVTSGYIPFYVSFTDTSSGSPTTWNWLINGASVGSSSTLLYDFTTVGTYNVTLVVSNDAGSDSSSQIIQASTYSTPDASLNMNVTSGNVPFCVNFTDSSSNNPTSYNTQIYDSLGYEVKVSTLQTFNYFFNVSGVYTIVHNVQNPSGSDSVTYTNAITAYGNAITPTPTPTIPTPNQTIICMGSPITLGSG